MAMVFARSKSGQSAQPVALSGGYWLLMGTLTLSGSYATGGDTVDLTVEFPGGKTIREAVFISDIRAGLAAEYDIVNKKIKLTGTNPAGVSLDVAPLEHPAAAYNALLTATPIPVAILLKG